jgi:hypothetical protein
VREMITNMSMAEISADRLRELFVSDDIGEMFEDIFES